MSKKNKQTTRRKKNTDTIPAGALQMLDAIALHLDQQEYVEAIDKGEKLLKFLPKTSSLRVEILGYLSEAYNSTQDYPDFYKVTDELLQLRPDDPGIWYNHGLASFLTSRIGRAARDFERAMELDKEGTIKKQQDLMETPNLVREMADEALQARGKDFTLEQLIAQEDIYQQGLAYMQEKKWQEAEDTFRRCAAIADVLPQPWGNIAGTLLLRERYDDAEAALRHALEIDPRYELAKENLKLLPGLRQHGLPGPEHLLSYDPFRGSAPYSQR